MSESNPLVLRVDALLKRHQQQAGLGAPAGEPVAALPTAAGTAPFEPTAGDAIPVFSPPSLPALDDDIPVLTEIVDPPALAAAAPAHTTVVEEIESAVIDKVLAELDLSLDMHLNRTIGEVLEQGLDGLRADLAEHVRRVVHEAVAAALAKGDTDDAGRS